VAADVQQRDFPFTDAQNQDDAIGARHNDRARTLQLPGQRMQPQAWLEGILLQIKERLGNGFGAGRGGRVRSAAVAARSVWSG
jgi:hypothetical protein